MEFPVFMDRKPGPNTKPESIGSLYPAGRQYTKPDMQRIFRPFEAILICKAEFNHSTADLCVLFSR